jgi:hypothetical protein
MCRADCGQWWPAKLCVQPGRPKPTAGRDVRLSRAIARAGVSPQARRGPPAESAAEADLGRGVSGAYVGSLVRPAAGRQYPGDWGFQSSPQ